MARQHTEQRAIRNLQRYLRQLASFDESLPQVPIDGIYDTETQQAVEIFQQTHGLQVTGVADRQTWDAIYEAYLLSQSQHAKPMAVDVFYYQAVPTYIRTGDVGFQVAAVQYMLNEVLLFYSDVPQISTDGRFGAQTTDAVMRFQDYVALPQTGEVDIETWNHLSSTYNDLFQRGNQ